MFFHSFFFSNIQFYLLFSYKKKTKQNKTKQNKTKQNKTKQNKKIIEKEEEKQKKLADWIYWLKQILSFVIGVIYGLIPLHGAPAIVRFG